MEIKNWLLGHAKKLLELKEAPEAVALGVAIGVFFGFTPLLGLKTLLAIAITWVFRGSKVAAAVAVTFHDVFLPIMPVLLRWEYDLGYWVLSHPHALPPHLHMHQMEIGSLFHWSTFLTVGNPLLVGSVIFAAPLSLATYFFTHWLLLRRQKKLAKK